MLFGCVRRGERAFHTRFFCFVKSPSTALRETKQKRAQTMLQSLTWPRVIFQS